MQKEEYLKKIFEDFGDFEVQKLIRQNGKTIPIFKNWVWYSKATSEEIIRSNVRSLTKSEHALDLDNKELLPAVLHKLKNYQLKYTTWDTGSRGFHILLVFPEMKCFDDHDIALFRKFLCETFGTDPSKGSSRTMLSIEWGHHFKTGKVKKIMSECSDAGENKLNGLLNEEFASWTLKQHSNLPTHAPPVCCKVDFKRRKPSLKVISLLRREPIVWARLQRNKVPDRSASDYLIAKCCVERGIGSQEYLSVLSNTNWSKIHSPRHGVDYAMRTYNKAYQQEFGERRNIT